MLQLVVNKSESYDTDSRDELVFMLFRNKHTIKYCFVFFTVIKRLFELNINHDNRIEHREFTKSSKMYVYKY